MDASAYSLYRREYLSAIDGILGTSAINTKQPFHTDISMSRLQFLSVCYSDKFALPRNSHTQRIGDGMFTIISWTIWRNAPTDRTVVGCGSSATASLHGDKGYSGVVKSVNQLPTYVEGQTVAAFIDPHMAEAVSIDDEKGFCMQTCGFSDVFSTPTKGTNSHGVNGGRVFHVNYGPHAHHRTHPCCRSLRNQSHRFNYSPISPHKN